MRFTELTTALTTPGFADVAFLDWLRTRFVDPVPDTLAWSEIVARQPDLADAALRMHHAGLLDLPTGARLTEQHRVPPTVEDWMALIEEWALGLDDPDVTDALRRALPSVGYVWTRNGVRRGRTPTDRVLARSEAKAGATVDIVTAEHAALGERMRMLVLCDHERAGATVPATLVGVLDQQAGSARAVLAALLRDPGTRALRPLLVTGSTVAGAHATLRRAAGAGAAHRPRHRRHAADRSRWSQPHVPVRRLGRRPGTGARHGARQCGQDGGRGPPAAARARGTPPTASRGAGPRVSGSRTSRGSSPPAAPRSSWAPGACSARGGTPAASRAWSTSPRPPR